MSNKINIIGGVRGATNTVVLTLELAAGSSTVAGADVKWTAICAAGVDDGDMAAATNINTVGVNPAAFAPNEMYSYTMALPTCSTDADVTLLIDSAGAGFTYERFDATVSQGLAVI